MMIRGIFVWIILWIGRFVVLVVILGVVWIIKFFESVMLWLNKFIVIVMFIVGSFMWMVIGKSMVLSKVMVGEGQKK